MHNPPYNQVYHNRDSHYINNVHDYDDYVYIINDAHQDTDDCVYHNDVAHGCVYHNNEANHCDYHNRDAHKYFYYFNDAHHSSHVDYEHVYDNDAHDCVYHSNIAHEYVYHNNGAHVDYEYVYDNNGGLYDYDCATLRKMIWDVTRFLKTRDDGKFRVKLNAMLTNSSFTKQQIDEGIRNAIDELIDGEHDHKAALYLYETVLAIRRYHIEDLRMRILELGDYTNVTAMPPFIDREDECFCDECADLNNSLYHMLSELVSSGDVTNEEDVYSKISLDCNTYAKRLVDSIYGEPVPAPTIPKLKTA